MLTGTSFDWGTLCSTERSVVADAPIRQRLLEAFRQRGGHVCSDAERDKLRAIIKPGGRFNVGIVGQSPKRIAEMAGFSVPDGTRALIAEVDAVGPEEPLSMETLSPILSFYVADGWERGCERCIDILEFGGIGHTLAIHAQSERAIEQFALKKPSMRIVVNTVAALGSVGMTTKLFPAMTLGPGTIGGSITSDNVSPLHLINVKRVAFETAPLNDADGQPLAASAQRGKTPVPASRPASGARTNGASGARGGAWRARRLVDGRDRAAPAGPRGQRAGLAARARGWFSLASGLWRGRARGVVHRDPGPAGGGADPEVQEVGAAALSWTALCRTSFDVCLSTRPSCLTVGTALKMRGSLEGEAREPADPPEAAPYRLDGRRLRPWPKSPCRLPPPSPRLTWTRAMPTSTRF